MLIKDTGHVSQMDTQLCQALADGNQSLAMKFLENAWPDVPPVLFEFKAYLMNDIDVFKSQTLKRFVI